MPALQYVILFVSVMTGGLSFFLFKKYNNAYLKLALSFTGAFLFGITVLHLIPEVYHSDDKKIGLYVLAGFLFQIILENFSEGIEHGHIHVHKHHTKAFPLAMMVSLCIHSFLEGMPLSETQGAMAAYHNSLLTGIILHHLPVAFALMSMLIASQIRQMSAVFFLALFAIMAPMGAYSSGLLSHGVIENISEYYDKIMAIVIGIFLHISTTILFESSSDHRFSLYKLFVILLGMGLVVFTM